MTEQTRVRGKARRHAAHVVHRSHGRIRIRVPSAKGDPRALDEIRKALCSAGAVKEVSVNECLGTVTVHYDPSRHAEIEKVLTAPDSEQKIALVALPRMSDLARVDQLLEKEAEFLASRSHAARVVMAVFNRLDREVKHATGNTVDFQVIAPLALAVAAFAELGIAAATPVWLTLGLFSFNHFIDLKFEHAAGNPPAPPRNASQTDQAPAHPELQRLV